MIFSSITKNTAYIYFIFSMLSAPLHASKDNVEIDVLSDKYEKAKAQAIQVDKESRKILGSLYSMTKKLEKLSRRKNNLANKMIDARANIKILAKNILNLEEVLKKQRKLLVKKLQLLYRMKGRSSMQVIFSSANSSQFDKNLKYLKLMSEHEYKFIKKYENNLLALNGRKLRLKREVSKLAKFQKRMKKQEIALASSQESKKRLFDSLKQQYQVYLKHMKGLRHRSEFAQESVFDGMEFTKGIEASFFEKKGQLDMPLLAPITQSYGLLFSEKYRYKLRHKGIFFNIEKGSSVKSLFKGKVSFSGFLKGYGETIILDHGDNYYSVYANLNERLVAQGDKIGTQQEIAKSGQSLLQNEKGLYFEIRHFSDAIDPEKWFVSGKTISRRN